VSDQICIYFRLCSEIRTNAADGGFGDAQPGDAFTLNISYDSTSPNLGDATFGVCNALISLSLTAGTFVASSSAAAEIQVDNNPGGGDHDRFAIVSRASEGLTGTNNGTPASFFFLRLDDSIDTVFSSNALPTSMTFSKFDSSGFGVFFQSIDNSIGGHVTGISTTRAVPMVGAGLPGIVSAFAGLIAWCGVGVAWMPYRLGQLRKERPLSERPFLPPRRTFPASDSFIPSFSTTPQLADSAVADIIKRKCGNPFDPPR
jgi:hypothetical protein